jgi:hypothetical protein
VLLLDAALLLLSELTLLLANICCSAPYGLYAGYIETNRGG